MASNAGTVEVIVESKDLARIHGTISELAEGSADIAEQILKVVEDLEQRLKSLEGLPAIKDALELKEIEASMTDGERYGRALFAHAQGKCDCDPKGE